MKIIGIIPARMAASRFPGKPMHVIRGRPMIEHVYVRSRMYSGWTTLAVATCDDEIAGFARRMGFPVTMTGAHHARALDRVAEAVTQLGESVSDTDVVVCVQGDEPMLRPDMIDAVLAPLLSDGTIPCTVLAMHITEESQWRNPDTVKIIHNNSGRVLYTSRAPIPYCKGAFSPDLMARRIYGIFAFRWRYLRAFTEHPETRLEQLEACDSNRILDMHFGQFIAPYPYIESFSVDSPADATRVERHMSADEIWQNYR